jgi:hypothetical protein
VEDIDFLSGFCCWKFKQFAKTGFGRKTQLSLQCVRSHIFLYIGNVFTLGPMAHATLVYINWWLVYSAYYILGVNSVMYPNL